MAMRVEIIGNLGHGAEVKDINGRECLSFDIAPSRGGREGGDTIWVSCLYYNTRVAEWLTKGRQVFVRGDYRDRIYTGRDGAARIDRSVMVTELELLGGGERAEENPFAETPAPRYAQNAQNARQPQQQPQYGNAAPAYAQPAQPQGYRQPNYPNPPQTAGTRNAPQPAPPAEDDEDLPF